MTLSKPPTLALALLAIGAFWYLSQRRAAASMVTAAVPATSQNALQSGAVQRYYVPPSGITPAAPTPLQSVLTFASQLIGGSTAPRSSAASSTPAALAAAYSMGGPSTGVYGVEAGIVRPADYVPTWTPDTQGEAAAQAYYLSNPDEFISNPPPILAYSDGSVGSTGGWLDNQ